MNVLLSADFAAGTNLTRKTTLARAVKDAQILMRGPQVTRIEIYAPTRQLGVVVKRNGSKRWAPGIEIKPQGAGSFEARSVARIHRALGFKN